VLLLELYLIAGDWTAVCCGAVPIAAGKCSISSTYPALGVV